MNLSLISLEIWVVALGLVLMLADFWMPAERRRFLGYAAAAALAVLLVMNLGHCATGTACGTATTSGATAGSYRSGCGIG